ncbi:MAG: T9SS type A sorting domain-containing protein [Bacteroidales bacterium]|nr:T9SS type A sorting domain-containing protein [Bacteroidales bacterium]
MFKSFIVINLIFLFLSGNTVAQNTWGHLANEDFADSVIKSTLFFTGNWRNGVQFYDYNPSNNTGLYTQHPSDSRHLGWSENVAYRNFAVNTIIDAGINVINFSYWGLPGTDNWAYWAPMQTSTQSHDELFDAVLGKPVLVAPFIESFAETNDFDGFSFMDDFPGTSVNPAPQLVELIEDLVNRYIISPDNPSWTEKWARVYDKDEDERYLISIIHVASNKPGVTDQEFAEGFDLVANKVYNDTEIKVGFALDILPPATFAPGSFKATPDNTGPHLLSQSSVLAVQCFIPEIWKGISNETTLIEWKEDFFSGWINSGIPFIHDVNSGYDAHIVFPSSPVYGNNQTWRDLQESLITELGVEALAFNAWNGYTEGIVGVPTLQHIDTTYLWVCNLFGGTCGENPSSVITWSDNQNFIIFPNPAQDYIRIIFPKNVTDIINLSVCSITNQLMISKNITKSKDIDYFELDINNLPCGIYTVSVINQENIYSKKFEVLH